METGRLSGSWFHRGLTAEGSPSHYTYYWEPQVSQQSESEVHCLDNMVL